MARKTVTTLVDDISGKTIEDGQGETLSFTFDGVEYQIDLDVKGAEKMRNAFAFYADHARRTGGRAPRGTRTTKRTSDVDSRAVRLWAASNGIELSSRGRIPTHVVEQYKSASN